MRDARTADTLITSSDIVPLDHAIWVPFPRLGGADVFIQHEPGHLLFCSHELLGTDEHTGQGADAGCMALLPCWGWVTWPCPHAVDGLAPMLGMGHIPPTVLDMLLIGSTVLTRPRRAVLLSPAFILPDPGNGRNGLKYATNVQICSVSSGPVPYVPQTVLVLQYGSSSSSTRCRAVKAMVPYLDIEASPGFCVAVLNLDNIDIFVLFGHLPSCRRTEDLQ